MKKMAAALFSVNHANFHNFIIANRFFCGELPDADVEYVKGLSEVCGRHSALFQKRVQRIHSKFLFVCDVVDSAIQNKLLQSLSKVRSTVLNGRKVVCYRRGFRNKNDLSVHLIISVFGVPTKSRQSMTNVRVQIEKYYDERFPFDFVLKLLSHAGTWEVGNREIMLSIPLTGAENPMRLRYRSVSSKQEWRALLVEHSRFIQIDVGAVFFAKPIAIGDLRSQIPLSEAVQLRELTFDIDLSDYADVRYCCGNSKKCCKKCWPIAIVAVVFLEEILRKMFGCKKLVWFYSGRRGVHCWVYDEKYASITQHYRESVINYIKQIQESINGGSDIPNYIQIALSKTQIECVNFFNAQSLFSDLTRFEKLIDGIEIPQPVLTSFRNCKTQDFLVFKGLALNTGFTSEEKKLFQAKKNFVADIIFKSLFPRFDAAVTIDPSHLIKMPFSLHPGTQNVCMPMTLEQMRNFDPESTELHMDNCTSERIKKGIEAAETMLMGK